MEFQAIGENELWQMIKKPDIYIIDLRNRTKFQYYHIEGAHNHPYEEIRQWILEIPKDKKVILYCEHGSKSMLVAKQLYKKGYIVYSLIGGINSMNR